MPSLTLLALDRFPAQRGLAASCQMFLQSMNNSVLAGVIARWALKDLLPVGLLRLAVPILSSLVVIRLSVQVLRTQERTLGSLLNVKA